MKTHSSRFVLPFLALLTAFALLLSACGDDDSVDVGDLGPDPATVTPADVPFYGEAVVRPQGDMLENFNATIGRFTGGEEPGTLIQQALDEELSAEGFSYSEDIEPWLGPRAGGFVTDFDPATEQAEGAVAVAVTDADAAQDFVDKARESGDATLTEASYNDVDYLVGDGVAIGIDGDFLIVGTEQGFKDAVDAADGDSLADNSDASASRDEIPEDALFSGYVDTQAAIDLIVASGSLTGAQLEQFEQQVGQYSEGPIDFWGTVGDDTVALAGSAPAQTDAAEPSDLVSTFPSDAWLAFAFPDIGAQLQTTLDQFEQGFQAGLESAGADPLAAQIDPLDQIQDATGLDPRTDFNWIGDVGGFAQGSSLLGLGGGLVIEATDEAAASDTVEKLRAALSKERSLQITGTDTGFDITVSGAPVGAQVAVEDGKFIAAAGAATVEDVLSPDETLDESDRFTTARDSLGDDVVPAFYLDFLPILQLVESSGQATTDPDYQAAKPYLDALDFLVAGAKLDGDRITGSLVLGLREASDDSEAAAAVLTP